MNIHAPLRLDQSARPLESRVSLVTGSTSGIGLGIARALAGAGSAVVLNGFGKPEDIEVLVQAAADAGLDAARARAILGGDEYEAQVREREGYYMEHGIHAVPAVIINDRHLIQGGQPPEVFEQALRQIAAQAPA